MTDPVLLGVGTSQGLQGSRAGTHFDIHIHHSGLQSDGLSLRTGYAPYHFATVWEGGFVCGCR